MKIPVDMIEEGQRLRSADPEQVVALVASIADVGLLNPITVYRRQLYRGGNQVEGFGLVAGLHRLRAVRELGATEIEAHVVELSDLERQIAECDENLAGAKLSSSERARFTRRRKDAYEALHPETPAGSPGVSRQVGDTRERSGADRFYRGHRQCHRPIRAHRATRCRTLGKGDLGRSRNGPRDAARHRRLSRQAQEPAA